MLPYQDPNHESYRASRRRGKHTCLGCGVLCTYSAWGPWCHPCNVARMDKIGATLLDVAERARFDAAVQEAVAFTHRVVDRLLSERNAILRAAGGTVTATKDQHRPSSHWSHQSHEDGSESYRIDR